MLFRSESEKVPDKALIYIKRAEATPLESKVLAEVMTIYVDDRVLSKIQVAPNHPESKLQKALLHEAILNDIALRSLAELRGDPPSYDAIKESLLGSLLKVLAKKGQARTGTRQTPDDLMSELFGNPSKFLTRIQAVVSLRNRADEAFEGSEE